MSGVGLRPTVAVHPPSALATNERLFELLGEYAGLRFCPLRPADEAPLAMVVVGQEHDRLVADAVARRVRVAALSHGDRGGSADVRFSDSRSTPRALRGVTFTAQASTLPVSVEADAEALAIAPSGPVWSRRPDGLVHRIGSPLPRARSDDSLRRLLGPDDRSHGFVMLALLEFLREVLPPCWDPPELRATFQFDDPNLRHRHYGHIDYRRLLDHAEIHGYHASIAMVPLDAGRADAATVELFRGHGDRLSLVMHGNDHRRKELLRADRLEQALRLGAHALRRIERFESATGLSVGRVMIPPHGMCSREVAAALAMLRYDSLCSLHPAPWTERPPAGMPLAGSAPATFVDGCAVLPRLPLNDLRSELAIRLYLGQPLVLYGHHDDLADGYEVLAEVAARVNALANVRWCSLSEIATTNHQCRVDGDLLEILPWSDRLELRIPPGVRRVTVVRPSQEAPDWLGLRGWTCSIDPDGRGHRFGEPVTTDGRRSIGLRMLPSRSMPAGATRAAELRDRASPYARAGARRTTPSS